MAGQSILKAVEEDLTAEFEHAHVQAHLKQFVALFAAGFLAALVGAHWQVTGWAALTGLLLGAAGGAARQMWPQLPWPVAQQVVHDAQQQLEPPPVPPAAPPHG